MRLTLFTLALVSSIGHLFNHVEAVELSVGNTSSNYNSLVDEDIDRYNRKTAVKITPRTKYEKIADLWEPIIDMIGKHPDALSIDTEEFDENHQQILKQCKKVLKAAEELYAKVPGLERAVDDANREPWTGEWHDVIPILKRIDDANKKFWRPDERSFHAESHLQVKDIVTDIVTLHKAFRNDFNALKAFGQK